MIRGWKTHLPAMLCFCGQFGQRSLCKSRRAWYWGMSRKGNVILLSQTLNKEFCSDFSKEKDYRFEIEAHSLIDSTNIWEHLFCAGVLCSLLWLQTWKGRNELPSQVCCIVFYCIIFPGLTSMLFANDFWSLKALSAFVWFSRVFKYLTMSKLFPIAWSSSVNSHSNIVIGKNQSVSYSP